MKLLLDTHSFICWDSDPNQLSSLATIALRNPANIVLLSVCSVWEMSIKADLWKRLLRMPLQDIVAQQLKNGLRILPISVEHALAVLGLPAIHKDPFDRMLVAQSNSEGAELVTTDAMILKYPVRVLS